MYYNLAVSEYHFREHDKGYKVGAALRSWRPQFQIFVKLIQPYSKVLDAGCGDGVLGEKLIKEKSCEVYGFDLDEIGVQEAKRRGVKAKIWDANRKFPYHKEEFDVVICNGLLELTKRPDFVVSEILRVGKTAIIEFENFGFWIYRIQLLLGRFPAFALYGHKWWEAVHGRFFSLKDFLRLPVLKKYKIKKVICIDWRNRNVSLLAKFAPNFFGRSCILVIEKNNPKEKILF